MVKLKLVGTGNDENRFYYIFNKDDVFLSLFPKFLLNCGFSDLGVYEDYDSSVTVSSFENKLENFKNEFYDIDVLFTKDKIFLVIRLTNIDKDILVKCIELISESV